MSAAPLSRNLRGMILMIGSMAGFASADAVIKVLAATHSQAQIIWVTGAAGAAVFASLVLLRGGRPITQDILAPKTIGEADLERCRDLGAAMAAGLAMGIF